MGDTLQIDEVNPLENKLENASVTVLLVDDQVIIAEAVRRMLADQQDIRFYYCNDPANAIQIAADVKPTVILQDLVMPDIDGLTLVKYFRANPATKEIPLIVLSVKEDPKIKANAFELGANDYAVKLPDKRELLARIRYHSTAYTRLLERNQAYDELEVSQKKLQTELAEAAEYVRTLLPSPLDDIIQATWCFIPSTSLGGDAFGYHWIDDDNFAIYLLDVCGHGVGAALLSISVMNVLRSQTLPNTNFYDPAMVLKALNVSFQMEKHNGMFFTMWYGVYNKKTRELTYSSGGHPPAILITGKDKQHSQCLRLKTPGMVIGGMPDSKFQSATCKVETFNKLFIFSDGVYELFKEDGTLFTIDEFIDYLNIFINKNKTPDDDLDHIIQFSRSLQGKEAFEDDFSLLKITFQQS
ncbi:MAG: SpoIIE family protein phosphatase [Chlamydiota bacterium]|nr:SpoIIE family protein phosphatase [Chlamydiota bacterium]